MQVIFTFIGSSRVLKSSLIKVLKIVFKLQEMSSIELIHWQAAESSGL